eukprot:CAMPEP_0194027970 /NCGR_PEP_ID=MMETSP0009_2-20130614/1999_1 /TAXON_ID=210454 /ORGANISM="Grammatophora oceanica, Strain CCMP 410" /LENGTH=318 /DNA_ID=CAMNT_0038667189 /DNA_START=115 /DNA_END=1071 /DNA_ORIENTATION=+
MKIVALFLLLATVADAATPAQLQKMKRVLSASRRLEDEAEDDEEEEEEEYGFLADYTLKFISCEVEQSMKNEEGNYEYSAVRYRLCPSDSVDCDEGKSCTSGYGDYIVGLNTFMDNYFEDQRENYEGDDDFQIADYAECRELDVPDQDEDERRRRLGDEEEVQYFVGPTCSEDGLSVALAMYSDEDCKYASDVDFYSLAGYDLPYGDGGLVGTTHCSSCYYQDDDGNYELSEFCMAMYENSGKCETNMETYSAYGKQEGKCEDIAALEEARFGKSSSGSRKVFWWILAIVLIAAVAYYFYSQNKKKNMSGVNSGGLMS